MGLSPTWFCSLDVDYCRCALQLMKDNPADFLRRVSIICLEDALLHPDMPLLVWLMCAQAKGEQQLLSLLLLLLLL